jgi:lipoprotein-anchoring transpeptidase ErfK/SrfK
MKSVIAAIALFFATPAVAEVSIQVDLSDQMLYVLKNDIIIDGTPVSTGKPGKETYPGTYKIWMKARHYYSRKYKAQMPYTQMIDEYGTALHAGHLPGYPASRGCIRMPAPFARKLFNLTKIGTEVVIEE